MKRRRRVKRWLIAAALLLIGGAIINVAVAWGIALLTKPHLDWWAKVDVVRPNARNGLGTVSGSAGMQVFLFHSFIDPDYDDPELTNRLPAEVRWVQSAIPDNEQICWLFATGWSSPSLWCRHSVGQLRRMKPDEVSGGIATGFPDWSVSSSYFIERRLPFFPLWPGFAINTLFYAAILWGVWMLFAMPFALRRWRRRRRGLCLACAYPNAAGRW